MKLWRGLSLLSGVLVACQLVAACTAAPAEESLDPLDDRDLAPVSAADESPDPPDAQELAPASTVDGPPDPADSQDLAPVSSADEQLIELPDLGPAPEIENELWINASAPVTLASQRGKVVLLEFWTFGCVNCQRVIPSVREWYEKYDGDDFTVVSVHYPEFNYEREYENVVEATKRLGVAYPVAIDNDRLTWSAYRQRFWPTTYLIDKSGRIRYQHVGEGAYAETERAINTLMAEPEPDESVSD